VTFVAQGCKTKVTLQVVFASVEAREASVKFGAVEGGEQTLARLDQYLAATPVKGSPPR
jgi:uncharacterized protein YndB with AHSA1/START domain